jgi:hypothetical protein
LLGSDGKPVCRIVFLSGRSRHALAVLCAAAALGGCGLGPTGRPADGVGLTATRDFGRRSLLDVQRARLASGDSALRVLQRSARVRTRSGGTVAAIDGVAGGPRRGWSLYVNGIRPDGDGAAAVEVHGGDRLWWDLHDTADIPAVVGSFPEPFVHGSGGRRLPVRVECDDPRAGPCDAVARKLIALGVPAGRSAISQSAADASLRVLVGPWSRLRGGDAESASIDAGPRASGVFARFDASGRRLVVLDARGRPARTLGPGTGLVAATRAKDRQPVWFVTGTDAAGVASAARAFDESALDDRLALAISGDRPVSVPLERAGGR